VEVQRAQHGRWEGVVGMEALSLHLPSHLLLFRLRLRCCSGCLRSFRVDGRKQVVEEDTKQNRLLSYPFFFVNKDTKKHPWDDQGSFPPMHWGCYLDAQNRNTVEFPVLGATRCHSRPVRARIGIAAGWHFNSWLKWRRIPTRGYPTP
jgi:hypothetical protein